MTTKDDASTVTLADLERWLRSAHEIIAANTARLDELDAAIGDGDHGTNMTRGFDAVVTALDDADPASLGELMTTVGRALVSSVGGASGPLYGTFFLRFGTSRTDEQELGTDTLLAALQAGVHGIEERGRSAIGQKTMLDAWVPALDGFQRSSDSLTAAIRAGCEAAAQGAEATVPMVATKGRASYLGERSAGHMDPGAASTAMIWQAALDALGPRGTDAPPAGDDVGGTGIAEDEAGVR